MGVPQALFCSVKIALTIQVLLEFHTNFRILCFNFVEMHWDFDRDFTDCVDCFGSYRNIIF